MVGLGTELGINGELLLFLHNNQGDEAITGGDGGIRTLDRALQPYNGLANRRLQPLGHVSNKADMPDAGASRKRQILGLRNAQPNQRLQRVYRRFPIAMPPLWAGSFAMDGLRRASNARRNQSPRSHTTKRFVARAGAARSRTHIPDRAICPMSQLRKIRFTSRPHRFSASRSKCILCPENKDYFDFRRGARQDFGAAATCRELISRV